MIIKARTHEEYKDLMIVHRLLNAKMKEERDNGSETLANAYKTVLDATIEKVWETTEEALKAANSATFDTEEPHLFIPYIVKAAGLRQKVAIEYVSSKGTSRRIIEPMNWQRASGKTGGINIVAWCHDANAWRHFNVKNMRRVAILDETFDRDEEVTIKTEDAKDMATFAFEEV